jgi:zinc protease
LEISSGGEELAKKLESLGARIEWGDNPYIPMDDYRLNPSFSFIRLEAPVANFEEAAGILIDYILDPKFTQSDFQWVQKGLTMELAIRSGFPLYKLKKIFYKKLFRKHPFANSLFPSGQCWGELSSEKLQSYRKDYFVGNKIIATIVSGDLPAKSFEVLSNLFSLFPTGDAKIETGKSGGIGEDLSSNGICPNFSDTCLKGRYEFPSTGSGAYLMAGFAAPVYDSAEMATILVATEIFNSRMQSEIRERLGLAYSTGCSAKSVKGGVVTAAYVGTRAQNLKRAQDALKAQIEKLDSEKPDKNEVATAINRITSTMARRGLSSINQASSSGENLFFFGDKSLSERIFKVELNDVNKIIDKYFSDKNMLYIDFLPSADGRDKERVKGGHMRMH